MVQSVAEGAKTVPYITAAELKPGLEFQYHVRAEKGLFGDFPHLYRTEDGADERFRFELHGSWLVAAAIQREPEARGHRARFEVMLGGRPLQWMSAFILPRQVSIHMGPEQLGEHPIQEGFATRIDTISLNNQLPPKSQRLLIPVRNIVPGSIEITGGEL